MAVTNIEKLSLKEINDLEARLMKAKAQARDRAKVEVKDKIDRILETSGFTISDLYVGAGRGRGRSKSAAKYANPENRAETWTGRGRKPNWLVARLKKGAKVEDFAI
ncbi:MAG: H-NS histone family protein [Hyphomicrobium sp.]|nr:H-NS histone family protein [Hyphomicrobium sp.]